MIIIGENNETFLQTCSRVLLPPQEKKHFLDQLSRPGVSALMRKVIKKKIVEKCKKFSHCPYCEALNGECIVVFLIH